MRNFKFFLCLLLGTLTTVAGCGSKNGQTLSPEHENGLLRDQVVSVLDLQRTYHLYVPENPSAAPMVLLLHGNRGSSDQMLGLDGTKAPYKVWMDIALRENLLLVIPNGSVGLSGHQGWNDCRNDVSGNPETEDVMFIGNLIEKINRDYQRAESKVFVVGTSNGGLMTMRLAEEMPEQLLAFAAIVAARPINSECIESTVPLPAVIMNGTADPLVPYEGGQIASDRGGVYSTIDTVAYWVNRNQLVNPGAEMVYSDANPDDESTVKLTAYRDAENKAKVLHYEIVGGGHTEPSALERYGAIYKLIVGEQNGDMEMAEEIWSFFNSL